MRVEEVQRLFDDEHCDLQALRQIGRGGFGEVWLVRKHSLDDQLKAVKILRKPALTLAEEKWRRDVEGVKRYSRKNVTHANLVKILETRDAPESFFYCMDAADNVSTVPGDYEPKTLKARLRAEPDGRFPTDVVAKMGLELLQGLEALHASGLCHRDVKPDNVLFVNHHPALTDMGCVAERDAPAYSGYTPVFAPPYAKHEAYDPVDHDLYGLGKTLYCAWTGKSPEDFPSVPAKLLTTPEGRALNAFLMQRACAQTRAERPRDGRAFAAGLLTVEKKGASRARRGWRRGAILLAAAGVAALCVAGWWLGGGAEEVQLPAMGLDGSACRATSGGSELRVAGDAACWRVPPADAKTACCLFLYPELELGNETEIAFELAATARQFDLALAFYSPELGSSMNLWNASHRTWLGDRCRWTELKVRGGSVSLVGSCVDGREHIDEVIKMPVRVRAEAFTRVLVRRSVDETGKVAYCELLLDGSPVAVWSEPNRSSSARLALALSNALSGEVTARALRLRL